MHKAQVDKMKLRCEAILAELNAAKGELAELFDALAELEADVDLTVSRLSSTQNGEKWTDFNNYGGW